MLGNQQVRFGGGQTEKEQQCYLVGWLPYLKYKAERIGIKVIVIEESYTSKASLLDLDEIPVYDPKRTEKPAFSGKRIKRGLYRASDGRLINADINGAGNTIRKVAPDAFQQAEGVEDGKARFSHALVVHPVRLVVTPSQSQKGKSRARALKRSKTL